MLKLNRLKKPPTYLDSPLEKGLGEWVILLSYENNIKERN